MKKILVSGKTGLLSSAISDYLRLKDGFFVEQLSLKGETWKAVTLCSYETIVHVAGITPKMAVSTEDYYKINTELTKCFAKKAKKDGVKHFIYISSMSVYGVEPNCQPKKGIVSNETPCNPVSDYGKSKLLAEKELRYLEDATFQVSVIRVPSIYGMGMTLYLEQYRNLNHKFLVLPNAFLQNYKSAIYVENLCELIYMVSCEKVGGLYCPDDGKYSAVDYCMAMDATKRKSNILGRMVELLSRNKRIQNYFGAVYYDETFAHVFEGKYRIYDLKNAVKKTCKNSVKEKCNIC